MNEPVLRIAKMRNCEIAIFDRPEFAEPWVHQYETETYEGQCSHIIKQFDYDCFFDIGAAFGYYASLAAARDAQVVAIEASPIRFGFMNWSIGHLPKTETVLGYVGSRPLKRPTICEGMTSLQDETPTHNLHIPRVQLSSFPFIDMKKTLVKVDIEGGELDLLNCERFAVNQPNIAWLIEVHRDFVDDKSILNNFPKRKIHTFQDHGQYVKFLIEYGK